MNEMYSEVREHLRQQHDANTMEIHGKKVDNFNKYRYYGAIDANTVEPHGAILSFRTKAFVFVICVMLFSCYIYGGQDMKKGASMAWSEIKIQIVKLEEDEPAVKQAMSYVRKAYNEVEDFTETYFNMGE